MKTKTTKPNKKKRKEPFKPKIFALKTALTDNIKIKITFQQQKTFTMKGKTKV